MNVGELKQLLNGIPDGTPVVADGPDSGGYDAVIGTVVVVHTGQTLRRLLDVDDTWSENYWKMKTGLDLDIPVLYISGGQP